VSLDWVARAQEYGIVSLHVFVVPVEMADSSKIRGLDVPRQKSRPLRGGFLDSCLPSRYCVTVKTPGLVAVPPAVVIAIFPVFAPVGTVCGDFCVRVHRETSRFYPAERDFRGLSQADSG
jgi:hypothetical protein